MPRRAWAVSFYARVRFRRDAGAGAAIRWCGDRTLLARISGPSGWDLSAGLYLMGATGIPIRRVLEVEP